VAGEAIAVAVEATGTAVGAAGVRLERRTFAHEVRGAKIVFAREMIRWWQDRSRAVVSLLQPILFLFVLGTGLSSLVSVGTGGISFRTFIFPGVIAMSTMFTAMFSAASLVWDREFGFLREMLVAPVSRASILIGKVIGGATVATIPGTVLLVLAGTVGVPYDPLLLVSLVVELFLLSFVVTAVGLVVAGRTRQIQSFMAITQIFLMPMLFLSGALFPLSDLPAWLHVLTRVNPLTYAVDPMRRAVFAHLDVPAAVLQRFSPGVTWGSWTVPIPLELLLVLAMGLALLAVAIVEFRRAE
jgi:daunorubicin resistance ABC transporter membrane protein